MGTRDYARGPNDKQWQDLKKKINEKYNYKCQLITKLTVQERYILAQHAVTNQLAIVDPAHVIAVSKNRDMMYDEDNVILLNRYSHDQLDHNCSPIDGRHLSQEKVHKWWARIVGPSKYRELLLRAKN